MAGRGHLPPPEVLGFSGYVAAHLGFETRLPVVPHRSPRIVIDSILWLRQILWFLGVHTIDVETKHVDGGPKMECKIGFSIRAKRGRGFVQISETGVNVPQKSVTEKYAVLACVTKLESIGYTFSTFSSVTIQTRERGLERDVEGFCAMIARNSQDVVEGYDFTYAGCSFSAILNQALYQFGDYVWKFASEPPTLTTEGFQAKVLVTKRGGEPTSPPNLIILSRLCRRSCEAKESAQMNLLGYINDVCGCRIGDLHFTELVIRENQ